MRLEKMTWPQVKDYFSKNDTVLLLFGSIEQHGKHNPLGTDLFAPQKISELVEDRLPELLIAPAMPFGSTPRFEEFPGTVNIGDELLYEVASKIITSLRRHGARHFIVLNGHGGNSKALNNALLDASRHRCRCALIDWWRMCGDIDKSWAGGHGGAQETSANLYIDPSLVDVAAIDGMLKKEDLGGDMDITSFDTVSYHGVSVVVPRPTCDYTGNGWMGPDDPKTASAEWGREMLTGFSIWLADFIEAFERTPLPQRAETED